MCYIVYNIWPQNVDSLVIDNEIYYLVKILALNTRT